MPESAPKKTDKGPLDIVKGIPDDKKLHAIWGLAMALALIALFKAYGLSLVKAAIYTTGISLLAFSLKEFYDMGIVNWAALPEYWNYALCVILFGVSIYIVYKVSKEEITKEQSILMAFPIACVVALEIFGPKTHLTGFSTDDIIAGLLGFLMGMGLVTLGYFFWRLVRYFLGYPDPVQTPDDPF